MNKLYFDDYAEQLCRIMEGGKITLKMIEENPRKYFRIEEYPSEKLVKEVIYWGWRQPQDILSDEGE